MLKRFSSWRDRTFIRALNNGTRPLGGRITRDDARTISLDVTFPFFSLVCLAFISVTQNSMKSCQWSSFSDAVVITFSVLDLQCSFQKQLFQLHIWDI